MADEETMTEYIPTKGCQHFGQRLALRYRKQVESKRWSTEASAKKWSWKIQGQETSELLAIHGATFSTTAIAHRVLQLHPCSGS